MPPNSILKMLIFDASHQKFKPSHKNITLTIFLFAFPECLLCIMKQLHGVNLLNASLFPLFGTAVCSGWCRYGACGFHPALAFLGSSLWLGLGVQTSFPRCSGQVTLPLGGASGASEDRREREAIPAQDSGGPSGRGGDSSCVSVPPPPPPPPGCGSQLLLKQAGITVLGDIISLFAPLVLGATAAPSSY